MTANKHRKYCETRFVPAAVVYAILEVLLN